MRLDADQLTLIVVVGVFVAMPPVLLLRALARRKGRKYDEAEALALKAWAFSWVYLGIAGFSAVVLFSSGVSFSSEPWVAPAFGYPVVLWFYARTLLASIRARHSQDMRRLWQLCEDELGRLPGAAKEPPRAVNPATAPAAGAGPAAPG